MKKIYKWQYRNCSYPRLFQFNWMLRLWRWWYCPSEKHLWCEVFSGGSVATGDARHYLVCDACQLMLDIESFDTTYHKVEPVCEPLNMDKSDPSS